MERAPVAPGVLTGSEPRRVTWWRVLAWQLYDFADTIYAMNVTSLYFGRWIMAAFGANSLIYSLTVTVANLLVAVTAPVLGALSDAARCRLPFQRFFAFGCCLGTVALSLAPNLTTAVAFFFVSYLCYSAATVFYQALLPGLAAPETISRISGIGVALGYCGSLAGIFLVQPFIGSDLRNAFLPTGILFLVFALPGLYLVPDGTTAGRWRPDVASAYRQVLATLQRAQQHRYLFRFLVADFLYENAVAAVIFNMAVYTEKVVGFAGDDLLLFMAFSTAVAIGWAAIYGPITDRLGPKPATVIMLGIWLVAFALVVMAPGRNLFFYVVGPLAGIGLGSTWVASRTFLIALTPAERSGEFFGLYSLSGKSAGVAGLATWSLVLWLVMPVRGEVVALQAAASSMGLFSLAGLLLVLTLPAVRPTARNVWGCTPPPTGPPHA